MKPDEDALEFDVGALVSPGPSRSRPEVAGEPSVPDDAPWQPSANPRGARGYRPRRAISWAVPVVVVAGVLGAVAYVVNTREAAVAQEPRFSDLSAPPTLAMAVDLNDLGAPVSPVAWWERPNATYVDGKLVISITNGRQLADGESSTSPSSQVFELPSDDGGMGRWEFESTALRVISASDLSAAWGDEWPYQTRTTSLSDAGLVTADSTDESAELAARAWSDGQALARRTLTDGPISSITSNAQVTVVTQPDGIERCRVTAFDLPSLAKRWEFDVEQDCSMSGGMRYLDASAAELIPVPLESNLLVNWATGEVVHDDPDSWAMSIDAGHYVVSQWTNDSSDSGSMAVHAIDGRKLFDIDSAEWVATDRTDPSAPLIAVVIGEGESRWAATNRGIRALDPWSGTEVWSIPRAGRVLGYTDGIVLAVDDRFIMSAHDSADGRLLWQAEVPEGENASVIASDSTTALLAYYRVDESEMVPTMAAIDLATGAELWRQPVPVDTSMVLAPDQDTIFWIGADQVQAWRFSGS